MSAIKEMFEQEIQANAYKYVVARQYREDRELAPIQDVEDFFDDLFKQMEN